MSSKQRKKELKTPEIEAKPPLMERQGFRLIYSMVIIVFFSVGIILLILSQSVLKNDYAFFIALAIMGIGVILLTMRSSAKHSSPPKEEEEKEKDTLQMRMRR